MKVNSVASGRCQHRIDDACRIGRLNQDHLPRNQRQSIGWSLQRMELDYFQSRPNHDDEKLRQRCKRYDAIRFQRMIFFVDDEWLNWTDLWKKSEWLTLRSQQGNGILPLLLNRWTNISNHSHVCRVAAWNLTTTPIHLNRSTRPAHVGPSISHLIRHYLVLSHRAAHESCRQTRCQSLRYVRERNRPTVEYSPH